MKTHFPVCFFVFLFPNRKILHGDFIYGFRPDKICRSSSMETPSIKKLTCNQKIFYVNAIIRMNFAEMQGLSTIKQTSIRQVTHKSVAIIFLRCVGSAADLEKLGECMVTPRFT